MKFDVPRITQKIALSEYALEYGERKIEVWVNPPIRLLKEHDQVVDQIDKILRQMVDTQGPVSGGITISIQQEELAASMQQAANQLCVVFSELWSQGPEETRWTKEEIAHLVEMTLETDPQLWPWLRRKTLQLITEHRERVKKV